MPVSSLMRVQEALFFSSVSIMAFSAMRSIFFIWSPPAPFPKVMLAFGVL